MKRFIVSIFFIIMCFLLQTTVFKGLAFGGIVPNLMIILTASFGFMRGEKTGLIMGFCCGFLIDIFFWKRPWPKRNDLYVHRLCQR